jgi:hypothetical protein
MFFGIIFSSSLVNAQTTTFNAVWCYPEDVSSSMLQTLVNGQVFNVFMGFAFPNPSNLGSLNHKRSDAQTSNAVSLIKNYDSRFHVWAWVGTYPHDSSGAVDLSTSGNRALLVSPMLSCCAPRALHDRHAP